MPRILFFKVLALFTLAHLAHPVTENNEIKPPSWSDFDVHLCSLKILLVTYFITDYLVKVISRKHILKALFITYPFINVLLSVYQLSDGIKDEQEHNLEHFMYEIICVNKIKWLK